MSKVKTDEDLLEFAQRLADKVLTKDGDIQLAESCRKLLVTCVAFLRDWMPEQDYTLCGVIAVLTMALQQGKYDTKVNFKLRETPLDLLFRQIEKGEKYLPDESGTFSWQKSTLRRKADGAQPGNTKGMPWGTDIATSFYNEWRKSAPPDVLEKSIYECIELVADQGHGHPKQ